MACKKKLNSLWVLRTFNYMIATANHPVPHSPHFLLARKAVRQTVLVAASVVNTTLLHIRQLHFTLSRKLARVGTTVIQACIALYWDIGVLGVPTLS